MRRIPESLAWEYGALAIKVTEETLTVAFASAPHAGALRRIERAAGLRVEPVIAPADQVQKELSRVFGRAGITQAQTSDAPAVRATARLHERAFAERCSDIHIEPRAQGARACASHRRLFARGGILRRSPRRSRYLAREAARRHGYCG